jgi:hypothetical protein
MSTVRTLLMVGVAAALASSASANLLANSSFEEPVTSDGPPFVGFWEAFSLDGDQANPPDASRNSTLMPRTGVQSLELIIDNVTNSFAGVFQDVPNLSEGELISYSGWHKALTGSGGSEIRIEWRDSINDVEISRTPNFTPAPGSDYEEFLLEAPVPAGADTARVVYAIQSFGGPADQLLYLDDFSVTPEPTALALLGLGLALIRRR